MQHTWFVVLMRIDTGLLCHKPLSLQLHIIEKVKQGTYCSFSSGKVQLCQYEETTRLISIPTAL